MYVYVYNQQVVSPGEIISVHTNNSHTKNGSCMHIYITKYNNSGGGVLPSPNQSVSCNACMYTVHVQYRAATSSKKLACTRMQATAACTRNYTHMRVHSVQCNVNLAATCEGLQLTLASACKYSRV